MEQNLAPVSSATLLAGQGTRRRVGDSPQGSQRVGNANIWLTTSSPQTEIHLYIYFQGTYGIQAKRKNIAKGFTSGYSNLSCDYLQKP
jgi:hypothetical protein